MTVWQSLSGMLQIRITGADIGHTLDSLLSLGISLYHPEISDPLTAECMILRKDYPKIEKFCEKQGNDLKILKKCGTFWKLGSLRRRPVLVLGTALLLLLVAFLPTRVCFFSVEGNVQIPDNRILEAAEDCGIRFGVSRKDIRSEKMKNSLLAALPELQWAGINTYGCRAVISVRERQEITEQERIPEITGIVAARDGVVLSCTATSGNALCIVGQSVKKDQLLISPYVDCGLSIRVVPAEGEIFAYTNRQIRAVTPAFYTEMRQSGKTTKLYSLILGKKRINFWKGSGISDATCGRMYAEYYITLPGGFRLPVRLAVETIVSRTGSVKEVPESDAQQLLQSFAADYVSHGMIAGTILSEEILCSKEKELFVLDGSYVCTEMIGRVKAERNGDMHE